jgi:hypothetical protein
LAGLSFITGNAKADPPPHEQVDQAPSAEPALPEMTIRAQREAVERRLGAFVASSLREPSDVSLARWNGPICPLAVGLPPEQGEFVHARVSEIAAAAGARLAPPSCRANLVVIVSAEPDAVLKAWYARDHRIFGDEAKPTALSAWDTAFLKALYHTSQKTNVQRSAITQSMVHDIAP